MCLPSLVVLSPLVLAKVVFLLKVLGALDAVVDSHRGLVFIGNQCLELRQLSWVPEVAMDLVEVSARSRTR